MHAVAGSCWGSPHFCSSHLSVGTTGEGVPWQRSQTLWSAASPSYPVKWELCTRVKQVLGDWSSDFFPGLCCQSQGMTKWWGKKRVLSPDTAWRTGRKLTGLGFAGAEDVTVCFSSAGRQGKRGSNFMLGGGWRVGVYMHMCACRRRQEKGGQSTKEKKRRSSESSDVSIDLLNTGTFSPFDVLLSSSAPNEVN